MSPFFNMNHDIHKSHTYPLYLTMLVCMLLLAVSCTTNGGYMQQLAEIDSLIFTDADSARSCLTAISEDIGNADEGVRAYYELLRIKADNKLSIKQKDDSVICAVAGYYESTNDPHLSEAYFLAGRANCDNNNGNKAYFYYQKALEDTIYMTDYLRSRIFAQIGYIMLNNQLFDEAKKMQELAHFYCDKIGDSIGVRYTLEDIATIDSLSERITVDESVAARKRLQMRNISEKVLINSLRKEKNTFETASSSDIGHSVIYMLISLILLSGGLFYFYRKRISGQDPESSVSEALGKSQKFYNKEVADLLESRIKNDKTLKTADWDFIETKLLADFPAFKDKLFSNVSLSETEYHICMLLKQDIAPSKIARLLAMGTSSVSQSRLRMQQKAFNGEGSAKDWDKYILSL